MPGRGRKGQKVVKMSEESKKRDYRLRPEEREKIRRLLEKHYGKKAVAKELDHIRKKGELGDKILELKIKMEEELEAQDLIVHEYYEQIDKDYKWLGRPATQFNEKELKFLVSILCTKEEIAGFFQIKPKTLSERVNKEFGMTWAQFYAQNSQGAKVSLRRRQFMAAMEGDSSMLKFLGKNILGQKENFDFSGEVKVNSYADLVKNMEARTKTQDDVIEGDDDE